MPQFVAEVKSVECTECEQDIPIPQTKSSRDWVMAFARCPHCNYDVPKTEVVRQIKASLGEK